MSTRDFASRLRRIEEKHAVSAPGPDPFAQSEEPEISLSRPQKSSGGGLKSVLLYGTLLMGALMVGGAGMAVILQVTSDDAQVASNKALYANDADPASGDNAALGDATAAAAPAWWDGNVELTQTFGQSLNDQRIVHLTGSIGFDQLGGDGTSPEDMVQAAEAQLQQQFGASCPTVLSDFASDCAMQQASFDVSPEDKAVRYGIDYSYAPSYAVGMGEMSDAGAFLSAEIELAGGRDVKDTPEGYAEVMARATAICGGMRVYYGNCVIPYLSVKSRQVNGENHLLAYAKFGTYADGNIHNRDTVKQQLYTVYKMRQMGVRSLGMVATLMVGR